jgi:hypothetical protein
VFCSCNKHKDKNSEYWKKINDISSYRDEAATKEAPTVKTTEEETLVIFDTVPPPSVLPEPEAKPEPAIKPVYDFDVYRRKVSEFNGIKKATYTVIIGSQYGKPALDLIADYIAQTDKDNIKYIFVSFYLKGMSLNGLNYAISERAPDTKSTQINYVEPVKESAGNAPWKNCKIIGKWEMAGGAITVIYIKGSSYYMADQYSKTSYGDAMKLIKLNIDGRNAFQFVEDTGEIFVVMPDGLYGYMNGDFACVFNKIE